jgi:hypothetical protein
MRRGCLAILLILSAAFAAVADDQQKAEKQIRMITAMSRDDTARTIISRTFTDVFKIDRAQVVAERKSFGLNYGGLFLAHEISGSSLDRIADQLRLHKALPEIAANAGADWKHIAADAKKMNNRITEAIYKHFLPDSPDKKRDLMDAYNPGADLIRADADSTLEEILRAQKEYIFWRNLAAPKPDQAADRSTPLGKSYEQNREDLVVTHGNTPTGPR